MIIWGMGLSCRITKATNTHSKYVKFSCLSTATMVAQKRFNVMLVRIWSVLFSLISTPNSHNSALLEYKLWGLHVFVEQGGP